MNTVQMYSGKGNYANSLPQPAPMQAEILSSNGPDLTICPRAFLLQTRLLDLSDQFTQAGFEEGPMQAVSNLLHHWLSSPVESLSATKETIQLHCGLLLADFLEELLQVNTSKQIGEGEAHA